MGAVGRPAGALARLAAIFCLVWLVVSGAWAQEAARISEIRVEGVQRIEPATVRSYMAVRVGDLADPVKLDQSLKSLFATGLFADVSLRQEGNVVVVGVVENPIINRIAFEGNKRLDDGTLEAEVRLRPRLVYTRSRVQADVQRLLDVYRRTGRFAATVVPKVIRLEQNRVDLVFEIDEGDLTGIRRITFIGNKRFSDSSLRDVIQTKESAWYRFLSSDDIYDPDRLTFDRELLRRHYLGRGYADFRVVSAVAELTTDREGFFVTFTIEEGERYKFGQIEVESNLRRVSPEDMRKHLTVAEGEWYDADAVEDTISALTDEVGSLGYAFIDIRPRVKRDPKTRSISVDFVINEGPRVFVERINIIGNVRTRDDVIRREMRLVEGDAFNTSKLRRSRQRIQNLGFFQKAEVTNVPGSTPDRTQIQVKVAEKSTGELSLGAGFSSSVGVLGDISIRERNLLGRGQDLRLGFQIGQELRQIDLSFTEPYFLNRELSAGFDLFDIERDLQTESSFDKKETGVALRTGYALSQWLSQNITYTLRQDEVKNVAADASLAVQEQAGEAVTSSISQTLSYDKRDNRFNPTEGYSISHTFDVAGLGGDVRYIRPRLNASYYYPFGGQWVGSLRGQAGYILGLGQDTRIIDRFFLGGKNFRGFEPAGIGPRDIDTGDAIGGNWFYVGTAEVSFPLGLPNEFAILGRVFGDFGSVGQTDSKIGNIAESAGPRASVGVGLTWRSPFGPVKLDFGFPVMKEDFDRTENFRFSFGTAF